MANMASSLIMHKRINTTVAKAKALRTYLEPLITKSKEDTTHSRRVVFSYLKNKEAVSELFREVAPRIANRPGGYTRILKTGFRLGDASDMCFIELVDFNEAYNTGSVKAADKPKTRRSRSGSVKKAAEAVEAVAATETAAEAEVSEAVAEKAPAKKPAAKKPAAAKAKPAVAPKAAAQKPSAAKTVAKKTASSKKA